MTKLLLFLASLIPLLSSSQQTLNFTILQLNDVYEIAGVEKGKVGGLARVATVRQQLLHEDPNTITMLAGDFVSPSLVGTFSYDDPVTKTKAPVAGRQMIEALNHMGLDYVVPGNHEFDIKVAELQKRINESDFKWVNSNIWLNKNQPFVKWKNGQPDTIRAWAIHTIQYKDGRSLRIGIIGATISSNNSQPEVSYTNADSAVNAAYLALKDQCDIIIALTHLSIEEDIQLAKTVPGLALIVGGHEHVASHHKIGNTHIYKADANARSVYIHRVNFDPSTKTTSIISDLKMIDQTVPNDPAVYATVNRWTRFTDSTLNAMGYQPNDTIMFAKDPLDGTEAAVRNYPGKFTTLIADAIFSCDSTADFALYNSGSLRGDEQLQGVVQQVDILRALPYGGPVTIMNLRGDIVEKILNIGTGKAKNTGAYLQLSQVKLKKEAGNKSQWYIKGKALNKNKIYKVLVAQYVAMGKEKGLSFVGNYQYCTPNAFKNNRLRNDVRDIVIWHMKQSKDR